jgi:molybdenum cofactor cytidylyltransferase
VALRMPHRNLCCVLLAAGSATRFGSQKLLARLPDGRAVIEAAVANLISARVGDIVAVIRPDAALESLLRSHGCSIVVNDRASEGMGTSIAAAVAASPDAEGWLVSLGDMPSIRVDSISVIANAMQAGAGIAIPVMAGRRGHPVGFSVKYREKLLALSGDTGARDIIRAEAPSVTEVAVDDSGIFADIDVPADLKR